MKTKLFFAMLIFGIGLCFGFSSDRTKEIEPQPEIIQTNIDGKAWWFITHTDYNKKKMFISKAFTNDCNHCYNEIRTAFDKYLVMNDYETYPNNANMSHYHDVSQSSIEKRRDELIYSSKQQGLSVITVNFSFDK